MTIKGMYRQDVYELPTDSIRELIANAVAHRSYLEPGNIQVALYDDRLEITSPGMLLNNVTIEKMIEGYSRPRNPAIARAFAYMKIIEKWGTGIPRLFAACEEYGLPKPELIDFDGDFRVNNQGDWIAEEDIGRVFEKFYKADKARTREYGGNGIGLSIVAATMEAHGKKYGVENVADGVLFYFDLDANVLADK